jgi:hypothetical protein
MQYMVFVQHSNSPTNHSIVGPFRNEKASIKWARKMIESSKETRSFETTTYRALPLIAVEAYMNMYNDTVRQQG